MEKEHTIRTRYTGDTHQAIDDRSWVKCTCTSSHEQAAFNLLKKQGITGMNLVRLHQREQAMRDPKRPVHYQWRVYKVVPAPADPPAPKEDMLDMATYTFPALEHEVAFSLLKHHHGTTIQITVDWLGSNVIHGKLYRKCEFEFHEGQASSETGYRSTFINFDDHPVITLAALEREAIAIAERNYRETLKNNAPAYQPVLF